MNLQEANRWYEEAKLAMREHGEMPTPAQRAICALHELEMVSDDDAAWGHAAEEHIKAGDALLRKALDYLPVKSAPAAAHLADAIRARLGET